MDDLPLDGRRSHFAFISNDEMSMAEIRRQAKADTSITPTQQRDLLSALNRFSKLFGLSLGTIPASSPRIRTLLASKSPAQLKLSEKTFANLRSLIVKAVRSYGNPDQCLTKRFPPTPEWRALLDRIDGIHHRWGLYRLASYCSVMNIRPEAVTSQTLVGLLDALEVEEIIKQPKVVVSQTITHWNWSMRFVPGWPQTKLSKLSQKSLLALPLSAFPNSFQEDVEAWRQLHADPDPDPFEDKAPPEPLRPVTIEHRTYTFRQFASALVACGYLKIEDVTSIRTLLQPDAFTAGLWVFRQRIGKTRRVYNMARSLRLIGKHYCRLNKPTLVALEKICLRYKLKKRLQLPERYRRRLGQFDNERMVRALLTFPEQEERFALRQVNPLRAAKAMERAVAVALLNFAALRIETLRTLELSDFTFLDSGRCLLSIPATRMKNDEPIDLDLNEAVAALLRRHIKEYRLRLVGSQGPNLFPGVKGGPRVKSALYRALVDALRARAGLEMNPHLFRHAFMKIAVEQDPHAYLAASRVLGHKTLDTTMRHYLGTESRAAGRYIDEIFQGAKGGTASRKLKREGEQ